MGLLREVQLLLLMPPAGENMKYSPSCTSVIVTYLVTSSVKAETKDTRALQVSKTDGMATKEKEKKY